MEENCIWNYAGIVQTLCIISVTSKKHIATKTLQTDRTNTSQCIAIILTMIISQYM